MYVPEVSLQLSLCSRRVCERVLRKSTRTPARNALTPFRRAREKNITSTGRRVNVPAELIRNYQTNGSEGIEGRSASQASGQKCLIDAKN